MNTEKKRTPLSPVRAIFHDVLPAEQRDVPSWLRKPQLGHRGSSLPPQTAAALLHAEVHRPPAPANDAHHAAAPPRSDSAKVSSASEHDPLFDARMRSASLAAEVTESWRPSPGAGLDERALAENAMEQVHQAISELRASHSQSREQLMPDLVRLCRLVCERVLEIESLRDPELPLRLVREGLHSLDHGGAVTVVLGSGFASAAETLETRLGHEGVRCTVSVLEQLPPFTCQVRAELGAVDESLETRLDNILASFLDAEED